ncbi:metallopeptidase family protein [Neomegalonema sp.]|uniref:metallopeptidase family protein n=1 Tax=Neomegalonema sp. TaxID=2039713 RepID=UPI0026160C9F|nr:metallopeptidase family protein [Neomegalonema sp.]MDD2868050.1 metallopeptidase family protein [Neomegalonema sp.]
MGELSHQDWASARAPDLEAFQAIADRAFAELPEIFREACRKAGVVSRIADFPDEETLDALGAESEFDLLGLFHGVGLPQGGATPQTGAAPNLIWLYRRPILDYWAEHDEALGDVIAHVLIHEIGHHLGFSDEDMEAMEAAAGD